MLRTQNRLGLAIFWVASAMALVSACGDDDGGDTPGTDAGMDAAAGSSAGSGGNGGNAGDEGVDSGLAGNQNTGGTTDQDASTDASTDSNLLTFTIPSGGGEVEFALPGGGFVTFAFPGSAAGQDITLELADAADLAGFEDEEFSAVIKMGPDGLQFDDPVIVTPSDGELVALTFPQSGDTTAPEQLVLAADHSGLELNHFSFLALVPLAQWCESQDVVETANAQRCFNSGAASTLREVSCNKYRYCSTTTAYCCVDPTDAGDSGCLLSSEFLGYSFQTVPDVTGDYPYCGATDAGGGGGDGGAMTCASAVAGLAGSGGTPMALECAGDGGASCVAMLDWTLGVSCASFCATLGSSCQYAALAWGSSTGADCGATLTPPAAASAECQTQTDADVLCHCQ